MEHLINYALQAALALVTAGAVTAPSEANAQRTFTPEFNAKVVHVDDGDTVVALHADGTKTKVRLANIDAPESDHGKCRPGQPFAAKSGAALKTLVLGKQVEFRCSTLDHYDRSVCDLHIDNTTANREVVRQGLAWANRARPSYLRDPQVIEAEKQAQAERRGLWSESQPVPPWMWRREAWSRTC